jgi:capsid portal protein
MKQKDFIRNLKALIKKEEAVQLHEMTYYSRQMEDDPFDALYKDRKVLRPPYDFGWLYRLYEESDTLQSNVASKVQNTYGAGYDLDYKGEDADRKPAVATDEKDFLENFFEEPNDDDSWLELTSNAGEDECVLGQMGIEFVRNRQEEVFLAFYHPMKDLRMVPIDNSQDRVVENVTIRRGKQEITYETVKTYRRYVRLLRNGTLRYYKSFGDKRPMGQDGSRPGVKQKKEASELWWIKRNFGGLSYGLPEYIGSTFDISGRRNAQAINWDLMRSQGLPPVIFMVEGELTDDSWDDLWNMVLGARGTENFNKVWVLQVKPSPTALNQQGKASIKMESISNARGTDQMFSEYLQGTDDRSSGGFRIPPAFRGKATDYSYGTMQVSKQIGEEQVFGPHKIKWAKKINRRLFRREWGIEYWEYKGKSMEIAGPQEIRDFISALTAAGALSINNAILLANSALGRNFSTFKDPWANYPIQLLLPILNRETLAGMENISTPTPSAQAALPPGQQQQLQLPPGATKADTITILEALKTTKDILGMFNKNDNHTIEVISPKKRGNPHKGPRGRFVSKK